MVYVLFPQGPQEFHKYVCCRNLIPHPIPTQPQLEYFLLVGGYESGGSIRVYHPLEFMEAGGCQGWRIKIDVRVAGSVECTVVGRESLRMSLAVAFVLG